MTDEQKMKLEMDRVRDFLGDAISACSMENGDVRFFNAAFLSCAFQLHSEIEGTASLNRAITRLAARELTRSGEAGSC